MTARYTYTKIESVASVALKLHEAYFKANQNMRFVGSQIDKNYLKNKFYTDNYFYIGKQNSRLGTIMVDTDESIIILDNGVDLGKYIWDRRTPNIIQKKEIEFFYQESIKIFLPLDMTEYRTEEFKDLITKLKKSIDKYQNVFDLMKTFITPEIIAIHQIFLNDFYQELQELGVIPSNPQLILIKSTENQLYWWNATKPNCIYKIKRSYNFNEEINLNNIK